VVVAANSVRSSPVCAQMRWQKLCSAAFRNTSSCNCCCKQGRHLTRCPAWVRGFVPGVHAPWNLVWATCCASVCCAGGNRILPVIPQLIIPIKTALNTRDPAVICR
jgi:hypothetical protein